MQIVWSHSSTVNSSMKRFFWGQKPRNWWIFRVFFLISIPLKKIRPSSSLKVPERRPIRVDLPAPFGPTIANVSPCLTLKETSLTATVSLYLLKTLSTLISLSSFMFSIPWTLNGFPHLIGAGSHRRVFIASIKMYKQK